MIISSRTMMSLFPRGEGSDSGYQDHGVWGYGMLLLPS